MARVDINDNNQTSNILDTSKIEKQLTSKKINTDCMEHAYTNYIMETNVKGTLQHKLQLYHVVNSRKLLHQGKWVNRGQIEQKFPHLMGKLNIMETIDS
jgi:hypothetical protein